MKLTSILSSVAAAAAILFAAPAAVAQNPGIAIAGTTTAQSLPEAATKFLNKHFKGVAIREVEKQYTNGGYEVELINGTDVDFDAQGKVTEIEAPGNNVLSQEIAKELLPHKTYKHLLDNGLATKIDGIKFKDGKVIEVETIIADPDTYIFDIDGNLIVVQD